MTLSESQSPSAAPLAPLRTRHAEAETCADPSSVMTLLADSHQTADGFTSYRSGFAAGAVGAPAHCTRVGPGVPRGSRGRRRPR